MSLDNLLVDIQKLSFLEKIRLIKILAEDVERPLQKELFVFDPNKVYYFPTPYNTYGAAEILMKALEDQPEN